MRRFHAPPNATLGVGASMPPRKAHRNTPRASARGQSHAAATPTGRAFEWPAVGDDDFDENERNVNRTDAYASFKPQKTKRCVANHVFLNDIIVVDGALTPRECQNIVGAIEGRDSDGFELSTSRGPKYGEAWRKNGRFQREDEGFADALWKALTRRCGDTNIFDFDIDDALGFNSNIRCYRYRGSEGEHFGAHVDGRVRARGGQSKFTALFYLSEVEEGGRTIFYDERGEERCAIAPKTGRALFFRHGHDLPEHEGEMVHRGTKYVLRSDVMFKC